jgi:RNA polymerase sigma factor for flagellar operon FliA
VRISGKIKDYLRAADWMPRQTRKRSRMIQKAISDLWPEIMREPTEEEIASHLNMTVEDVRQGLADSNRMLISLDGMTRVSKNQAQSLDEILIDETQDNPLVTVEEGSLVETVASAIQSLPERERLVLSLYYNDELTFREIGKVLNLTESRACQLHARAILSLKAIMRDEQ